MAVAPRANFQMQRRSARGRKSAEKIFKQRCVKRTDLPLPQQVGTAKGKVRTPAQIDGRLAERLIKGHACEPEAADSSFLAQRFLHRRAEHDTRVFDGVM